MRFPVHDWALLAAGILGTAGLSHASIVFSDNFDTNHGQATISSGPVDSSVTGTFNVTGGNVDVVGLSYFPTLCSTPPETGSCVDLDGSTAGTITSTSITLLAGHSYTLAFDIFGTERGPDTTATATFGSFYSQTFAMHTGDQNFISTNFLAAGNTSANIVFASNDSPGDSQGALIDNVVVTDNGSTVPEPGSAALLLAGAAAWAIRRKR